MERSEWGRFERNYGNDERGLVMDLMLQLWEKKSQDMSNSYLFYKASGSVKDQFKNRGLNLERKRICLV